jgi:flagellar L-ring protein precursor FlgH
MGNRNLFVIVSLVFLLGGCTAAQQQPTPIIPVVQPMAFQDPPPSYNNPGSIFDERNASMLFADSRARRVGDIVQVHVVESSSGTNTANTTSNRTSATEFSVNSLFGMSTMPLVNTPIGEGPAVSTASTREFEGKGSTTRKNTVTATVAARVVNVMPDGLMRIEGVRETKVNSETQYLVVAGLIRSRDVAADNSIMSTQIADAHIEYYGKGIVSDRQKPGWLSRLLDTLWPF